MIFEYFKFNRKISRPIVTIILRSAKRVALYSALIDSGSDYCIFGLGVANGLDIKLEAENKTYETKVIFADISDVGYGILSQQGFFDHFDVNLSYQKQEIEINPIKIAN